MEFLITRLAKQEAEKAIREHVIRKVITQHQNFSYFNYLQLYHSLTPSEAAIQATSHKRPAAF
jgi:ABC-type Zn uptake system ZnuABC Zn-binding protein ZnuA